MQKILFLLIILLSLLASCTQDSASDLHSETNTAETTEVNPDDVFEKDWQILKKAIIAKDEAVVLTFVSNEDPVLKEAIDISYEFIFDDEVIEKIKDLKLEELDKPVNTDVTSTEFGNRFISIHKQKLNDSIGQMIESTLEIELLKTKNGLKITNYKTFHQVYDTE